VQYRGPDGRCEAGAGGTLKLKWSGRVSRMKPEFMWAIGAGDHLIYGNNSEYRLRINNPDGSLERIIELMGERRPLTQSDQAEFRKLIRQAWEDTGAIPPQAIEMMSQALSFASHYPAYANLLGGPDGTIWVQGVQTPEIARELGSAFDMRTGGGRPGMCSSTTGATWAKSICRPGSHHSSSATTSSTA
jgi:hypothetical protein